MKKVKISGQSFELEKGKESLEFIKRPGNITLLRYTDPVTHAIVQKRFYYQQSGNTFSAHFDQHSVLGEWSLKKRTEGTDSKDRKSVV